ncbi:major histocompatibility complex class I ULA precursor [Danio rerio]|uniref:MHC class I antigen transcript variant 2 n=2 Tax=Danio rerio TaxID=7955 RepID=A0A0S1RUH3_DANRE|nr:major histocompatibility complex class I ULA precursor [Danio rerio]ALL98462.1 MHC class I antigen transcript variant 2 [Danio rerio]|eukprot:NP_001304679.1 major histocompatibility complex class I ULA precursor [Danio rerio]
MKIIVVFICIPFVCSGYHGLITTYTGIRGASETPIFIAVAILDGEQIDYYDSVTNKLIPKQDWMKEYASEEIWKEDCKIRGDVHQIYRSNINVLMQRFNQSNGVHVYQRMYGCDWDEETEESHGFDQYGYDGEDYVMLDMREIRYITPVQQGEITVQKWNSNREQLKTLQHYYKYECVYWLKQFLGLRKADLEIRDPEVFLLQKNPSSPVECFATGFYPSGVIITWLKNGQDHGENVELRELKPNEDGTFQRSSSLHVSQEDWKKSLYTCVVEHQRMTIQKSGDEIKSNSSSEVFITPERVLAILLAALVICLCICYLVYPKKLKPYQPVNQNEEMYEYIVKNE